MNENTASKSRKVTFGEAIVILIVVVAIMFWGTLVAKIPTAMSIVLAATVCGVYGALVLKFSWKELFDNVLKTVNRAMPSVYFLMMGGAVAGTYIACGAVPFMMYWGLKLLHPSALIFVTYVILSIISMSTGRAWATIQTIGLALCGVAVGLGVPIPIVAGAAVSGAFIGDKWTPIGDVQGLTSGLSGIPTVQNFKAMMSTTGLGALIAGVLYLIVGFRYTADSIDVELVAEMLGGLSGEFNLSIITLLPLVFIIGMLMFTKKPIIPVVFGSIALAVVIGMLVQGKGFLEMMNAVWTGAVCDSGVEVIDSMLTKGGVMSFASLIFLLFCAFVFAGFVEEIGVLDAIASKLANSIKSRGPLVLVSSFTTILTVWLTSSVYVSQILNYNMYEKVYEKFGLHRINLARTITDCAPMFGAIVPWSGGAVVAATALGISTWTYMPYVWTCYIPIILGIIYGFVRKSPKYFVPVETVLDGEVAR